MACIALPFRARLEEPEPSWGPPAGTIEPLWRLNPWRHADVSSFLGAGKVDRGDALVREHPTWLGAPSLGLALAGGGGAGWVGVALPAVAALGDTVAVAGRPVAVNPAEAAFDLLPVARSFKHHARLMILGQAVLVVLAARGALRLAGRFGAPTRVAAWEWTFVGLIAIDLVGLSPLRIPLPGTPAESPAIYTAISTLPPGPVAVLGAAGPGIPPQKVFYDQRAHGRPLLHDPNRPGDPHLHAGVVLVALGDAAAREAARRGPPAVETGDGAAWWIESAD